MESIESFPIPKGYRFCTHLGVSPFGSTEVVCDEDGKPYVCKEILKQSIGNAELVQSFKERLDHIKTLKIPFVIPYKDIIEDSERLILVREYLELKSFAESSERFHEMKEKTVIELWNELVRTYYLLHQHQISPNFIRITNLFLGDNGIHITDLYPMPSDVGAAVHTPNSIELATLAPEFFNGKSLPNYLADTWSLGVILAFMATGSLPFQTKNVFTMMTQINNGELVYVRPVSKKIDRIVRSLVVVNPNDRRQLREVVDMRKIDSMIMQQSLMSKSAIAIPHINVDSIKTKNYSAHYDQFSSTDPVNPKTTRANYMSIASLMTGKSGLNTDHIVRNRRNPSEYATDGPHLRRRPIDLSKSNLNDLPKPK